MNAQIPKSKKATDDLLDLSENCWLSLTCSKTALDASELLSSEYVMNYASLEASFTLPELYFIMLTIIHLYKTSFTKQRTLAPAFIIVESIILCEVTHSCIGLLRLTLGFGNMLRP